MRLIDYEKFQLEFNTNDYPMGQVLMDIAHSLSIIAEKSRPHDLLSIKLSRVRDEPSFQQYGEQSRYKFWIVFVYEIESYDDYIVYLNDRKVVSVEETADQITAKIKAALESAEASPKADLESGNDEQAKDKE